MIRSLPLLLSFLLLSLIMKAQPCTPTGDEVSFGSGDVWTGYMYDNTNFTTYRGFITAGTAGNSNFDMNFGGSTGTFNTSSCTVDLSTFSVRYKLRKTFSNYTYRIIVGGDDGYRLSLDNGATWVINRWNDQGYVTTTHDIVLNGTYDMILEYYENSGDNRVSFSMTATCMGSENTADYGTNNVWNGYVYDGTNFNQYIGMINGGTSSNPNFDHNFGGSNVSLPTSACATTTETFSVRYRLRKAFAAGTYQFTVGADDGYRLSLDGGATWLINRWNDQSYSSTISTPESLNGTYDMVLEYYENGGDNRVTFSAATLSLLPITLIDFKAVLQGSQTALKWRTGGNSNPYYFEVQKSLDNREFNAIGRVEGNNIENQQQFSFTDNQSKNNRSYYRLKMVDLDGNLSYSPTLVVNQQVTNHSTFNVYPTIATGQQVQVSTTSNQSAVKVLIMDQQGQIVFRKEMGNLMENQPKTLELSTIRTGKGMYFVQLISSAGNQQTVKIIIP